VATKAAKEISLTRAGNQETELFTATSQGVILPQTLCGYTIPKFEDFQPSKCEKKLQDDSPIN